MRLAIADDSGIFRESLRVLLEQAGAEVVAIAASGQELLTVVRRAQLDAAIVDIRMRSPDEGIATAAELRRLHPDLGILMLSAHVNISYAQRLIETVPKAMGYLLKDNVLNVGDLRAALRRVVAGEMVIEPSIVERLLRANHRKSRLDALNERERSILRLMAEGRSNRGIADELYLSHRTVEANVTSIFSKLGLDQSSTENNRVRAVLALLRADET